MVAQREKVDILPVEKLVYIPAKQKLKASEKEEDTGTQKVQEKDEDNSNMITIEK